MKKILLFAAIIICSVSFAQQQRLLIINNSSYTFQVGQINTYQRANATYVNPCPERSHYYYGSREMFDIPPGEMRGFGNPDPSSSNFPFYNGLSNYVQTWTRWVTSAPDPQGQCTNDFTIVTSQQAWSSPIRDQVFSSIKYGLKYANGEYVPQSFYTVGSGVLTGTTISPYPSVMNSTVKVVYSKVVNGNLEEHFINVTDL